MTKNDILTRAVSNVTPRDLAENKFASGKPLRVYLGIDPTGSKLHLGHSVPLRKLKAFQDAGHHVIFLVGDFTAMIGDPTDRDAMREALTREQVEENFQTYKQQASKILDFSRVELRHNYDWLSKLTFEEVTKLAANFTMQQMMQRDMFEKRLKEDKPIHVHEFLYPLMQGYDSVTLDVDVEIGGNDQYFNLLAGRTLQAAYGKREKFVLTTRLIEGTDGQKMSKTYNNCIYLEDEPNEMFGKIMSMKDELITEYLECCTDVSLKEIAEIKKAMAEGANPRNFKARLAREIVTLYHDSKAADKAQAEFEAVFKEGGLPENISEITIKKDQLLLDVLYEQKLIASTSEGRRLIKQNGIKIDGRPVTGIEAKVQNGIVKVGKRKFLKLSVK